MKITVRSLGDLEAFARHSARQWAASVEPSSLQATVVALSGDLGAGKTTFTQSIARAFGIPEAVTSPTFVILKTYALSGQKFERLIHIDAYRLHDGEELRALGFVDLLSDPKNLIVIEWPERVKDVLPEHAITISFVIIGDDEREIETVSKK